jgi:hypothetical protein
LVTLSLSDSLTGRINVSTHQGDSEMTANVGNIDRILRIVLGLVLIAAPFVSGMGLFASTAATVVSVVAGLVLLGTSAMRFCPLYRILGIQTCKL